MSAAPRNCNGSILSFSTMVESNTAESGSIYPHTATVCAGSFPMEEI